MCVCIYIYIYIERERERERKRERERPPRAEASLSAGKAEATSAEAEPVRVSVGSYTYPLAFTDTYDLHIWLSIESLYLDMWEGWVVAIPFVKVRQFDVLVKLRSTSREIPVKFWESVLKRRKLTTSHNSAFPHAWASRGAE